MYFICIQFVSHREQGMPQKDQNFEVCKLDLCLTVHHQCR